MKKAISAGGIVTKLEDDQLKICLVELTPPMDGFVFPKGHIEQNESQEETALREVSEETGLTNLKIEKYLGCVTRKSIENSGKEVIKDIHLYLMQTDNYAHTNAEENFSWVTINEALEKLTFNEEKDFLKETLGQYKSKGKGA